MRLMPLHILVLFVANHAIANPPRPSTDRIDAVVGQPIILRLHVDNENDLRDGLQVQMDDGRTIECPVFWVGADPSTPTLPQWTNPPVGASATQVRRALLVSPDLRAAGGWYTRVGIPLDAVGQGLWIEGERYELNWLPDPERAMLEADGRNIAGFFRSPLAEDSHTPPMVQRAIDQFASSPFTRWRARLLLDGLDPSSRYVPLVAPRPEAYLADLDDEINNTTQGEEFLETLAHQSEIRWQIILGRIWLIDEQLAERIKHALTRVVGFDSHPLPMWPSNQNTLAELAHDLLSPWVDDELRATRARAWLDTLPRASAWVIDDLGTFQPEIQKFTPTLGIVSMPPLPGSTLVRLDAPGAESTLTTIGDSAMQIARISTPPETTTTGQTIVATHDLRVRLGRVEMSRTAISAPYPAQPPGVRVGPLQRDWTMDALMQTNPPADAPSPLAHSTVGVLHRTTPTGEPDASEGWTLYLECAAPNPIDPADSITLWVGPYSHPIAAWEINALGNIEQIAGSFLNIPHPEVQIAVLDDRWTIQIALPPDSIGDDLLLSLGLERDDASGYHSAWPRRMIPVQDEPGRLIIDVSTWDGFRNTP